MGGVDHLGHVERLGGRALAAAREREQLGEQAGEPLGLVLRGGELALDLGVAALQRGGLEAQPQAGERGAQLVRRVRHELALAAQRARHPVGHVVEGGGHLPLLGGALDARARVEIAVGDAARRSRKAAQRLRERAGEEPGHDEAEQQRHDAHADERDHVVALLVVHGVDALGHAHRPDRPAARSDRHGGEEEVLVEQVAVALALGGAAAERGADLGAVAVAVARASPRRPSRRARGRGRRPRSRGRRGVLAEVSTSRWSWRSSFSRPAGAGGDQLRLRSGPRS